mgnify:CR=1 FL=1
MVRMRYNYFLVNPTSFQSCDWRGKSLLTRSSKQSNVSFFVEKDSLVILAGSENHRLCILGGSKGFLAARASNLHTP